MHWEGGREGGGGDKGGGYRDREGGDSPGFLLALQDHVLAMQDHVLAMLP